MELRDKGKYGFVLPPDQIIPTGKYGFVLSPNQIIPTGKYDLFYHLTRLFQQVNMICSTT